MTIQNSYSIHTARFKKLMKKSEIIFTSHAKERMKERCVIFMEVEEVLRKGRVTLVEYDPKRGNDKFTVEGSINDYKKLKVVISLLEEDCIIKVITVMTP